MTSSDPPLSHLEALRFLKHLEPWGPAHLSGSAHLPGRLAQTCQSQLQTRPGTGPLPWKRLVKLWAGKDGVSAEQLPPTGSGSFGISIKYKLTPRSRNSRGCLGADGPWRAAGKDGLSDGKARPLPEPGSVEGGIVYPEAL